jgi:hypothetical protein
MQRLVTLLLANFCGDLVGAKRLPSSAFGVPGVKGEFDYIGRSSAFLCDLSNAQQLWEEAPRA